MCCTMRLPASPIMYPVEISSPLIKGRNTRKDSNGYTTRYSVREPIKRDASESVPYVTINGQRIDARDRQALDEAFKRIAKTRDRVIASLRKHLGGDRGRT